jgi:D-amino-acid dehydrogenase
MKIAIIGAGIVGVTSAYELAADGHQVTVLEQRSSVAAEASFANAGLIAPSCAALLAESNRPSGAMAALLHHPSAARGDTLRWLWQRRRSAQAEIRLRNRARLHQLALYSHERLQTLRHELQLSYERQEGLTLLLRSARELRRAQPMLAALNQLEVKHRVLDAAQCRALEPGLNEAMEIHAAIHFAQDEVGNCREFAHLLRIEAQRLGVQFHFNTAATHIDAGHQPRVQYESLAPAPDGSPARRTEGLFDAVLVCAGNGSRSVLGELGIKLPMVPIWGHTITAPLRRIEAHPELGPASALLDTRYGVTISRMGQRVRVSGGAALDGRSSAAEAPMLAKLHKVLHDWFPGATVTEHAQHWKGGQPTLPDGLPVLGPSGHPGIWLNLGHGASGWTLACGSARLLADQIGGQACAIDAEGLDISRLR